MSRHCVFLQACGEAGHAVWVRSDSGAYRAPVYPPSSFHFSSDLWHGRKVMMSDHCQRKKLNVRQKKKCDKDSEGKKGKETLGE